MMVSELLNQVKKVNELLKAGEPANVSLDEHSGYTGYKPQFVIDAMNEVFGIGAWGFEEMSNEIVAGDKGGLAIAQVRVWLAGSESHPTGWGQNRVTRGDIGDAHKGAQTDALKKALSYFSVGTRAYQGLLVSPDKGKPQQQQRAPQPQRQPQPTKPANVVQMPQKATLSAITPERVNALYDLGKANQHWQSLTGMCAFASAELGINVAKEDFLKLSQEHYQQLVQAVEQDIAGVAGR